MPAQGRKNVHGKAGVRFKAGYTASKRKGMLRNVVTELIIHEEIKVTSGVAPEAISLFDRLVTYAKKGDVSARREAAKVLRPETDANGNSALSKLFGPLAESLKDRQGGYLETYKLGARKGDNAEVVLLRIAK